MSTITWLHLSDLHLRGTETSVDRGILNDMLLDIRACQEEEDLELDAVFFTGDVAFSSQTDQYSLAAGWLDEILEACGLSGQRNRLFIVPGNHDVDRRAIHHPEFVLEQYESFAQALLDPDKPYDEIHAFLGDDDHSVTVVQPEPETSKTAHFRHFFGPLTLLCGLCVTH